MGQRAGLTGTTEYYLKARYTLRMKAVLVVARALTCDRMRAVWSGKALPAMDLLSGNTNYFTYWKLRVAWWLAKTFCFEAGFANQPKCFVGRTKRGFRAIYSRLYHPH